MPSIPRWLQERSPTVFQTLSAQEVLRDFGVALPPILLAVTGVLPERAFVAGGFLTSVLAGLPTEDIDVWCSAGTHWRGVPKLLGDVIRDAVRDAVVREPLQSGAYTESARPSATVFTSSTLPKIAVHYYEFDGPEHALDSFDFTVSQIALLGEEFIVAPTTLEDIRNRRLAYARPPRPENDPEGRVSRYLSKGFKPSPDLHALVRPFSRLLAETLQADALVVRDAPPKPVVEVFVSSEQDPNGSA